ncbi:hypothetical protein [Klebsiella pasteurii]|uniref:hypothetical protein n=1 Tax=Klebsiella pasteurii TaxID=2587529 RepID=UPI00287DD1C2|nr:hypothetical protein [Klebsiella pasteurii]MDS7878147.1 hypothetical protein [Klebsiella pasteurii]
MKRIGVLGVDALSEKLIAGFFQAETGAQVFLSPANSERAQRLAREFPCWTLDNHQAVLMKRMKKFSACLPRQARS